MRIDELTNERTNCLACFNAAVIAIYHHATLSLSLSLSLFDGCVFTQLIHLSESVINSGARVSVTISGSPPSLINSNNNKSSNNHPHPHTTLMFRFGRSSARFHDRHDAAHQLFQLLKAPDSPIAPTIKSSPSSLSNAICVISLPRGGTIIGDIISEGLGAHHDIIFPRKIGHPGHEEFAIGALTDKGDIYWNEYAIQHHLTDLAQVKAIISEEREEAIRRSRVYRGNRPPLSDLSAYQWVILVDDGLATGATMKVAIQTCKKLHAQRIMVAVPCASPRTVQEVEKLVDSVVCIYQPSDFSAVGLCFERFDQTTDEEVINIMKKHETRELASGSTASSSSLSSPSSSSSSSSPSSSSPPSSAASSPRSRSKVSSVETHSLEIRFESGVIKGDLNIPQPVEECYGLVVFAHGSGSSRLSTRNRYVARELNQGGLATFLVDLLTAKEAQIDDITRELRFNIPFLANRLVQSTDWLVNNFHGIESLADKIGYFGASTGSAAAILAGISLNSESHEDEKKSKGFSRAIVSRGGRPDLVPDDKLKNLNIPTLVIVGGDDTQVISLNEKAYQKMEQLHADDGRTTKAVKKMEIVPGATHLFEEAGTLEQVAKLAKEWFQRFLPSS